MRIILVIVSLLLVGISATYNTTVAKQLALLSKIAYQTPFWLDDWSCQLCKIVSFKNPLIFYNTTEGDIQGFAGYSPTIDSIVLAFRGSKDLNNWIQDLKFLKTAYKKCGACQVHTGFYTGYNSVSQLVKKCIGYLRGSYPTSQIMITGHGLGGALAILAADDLRDKYVISQVYTFGQPRIGNPQFVLYYSMRIPNTWRLIDYADIVPHLPPQTFGFNHSSAQVWYQKGMISYRLCLADDPVCSNSLSVTEYSTDDHSLNNYLKMQRIMKELQFFEKQQKSQTSQINLSRQTQINR